MLLHCFHNYLLSLYLGHADLRRVVKFQNWPEIFHAIYRETGPPRG